LGAPALFEETVIPTLDQIQTLIRTLAAAEGLDPEMILRQCKQESSYNPDALNSHSGAMGLFQLEPATAKELGVQPHRWHENVFGGIKYDGQLFRQFGTWPAMLAAYNWGPGNLHDLMRSRPDDWIDHLPPETDHYLDVILPRPAVHAKPPQAPTT
jgi:soluble lytic murein transglycosylase-like protein